MQIDAHQHFWRYKESMQWITPAMSAIRKDFLPADLWPLLKTNGIDGCIAVQAEQTKDETMFLLQLAEMNPFIKGVVGWVDLRAENINTQLADYSQHSKLKGFRHVLQSESPDFMLTKDFIKGISALKEFNFTYDLLIFPEQLAAAVSLVKQFPYQPFVIDHLAKPGIKEGTINQWATGIKSIAAYENVYCKISGLVTEADWHKWKRADFIPYLDIVIEAFGTGRIMYGSDWPVCLLAASYEQVMGIVREYFSSFSNTEQQALFGENASRFYQVS